MRLRLWLAGVGAAAAFAAASTLLATGWPQQESAPSGRPQAGGRFSTAPAVQQPLVARSGTGHSSPPAGQQAPTRRADLSQPGPLPTATPSDRSAALNTRGQFWLTVRTTQGEIQTAVAALRATLRSDGTAEPIDPPHDNAQQWNTAAWIEQSAYPAAPAHGPSYIYGHACHYHICSFSRLRDAVVGDTITIQTTPHLLTYRVCASGLSPKAGNLVVPACNQSSADLVLVTCQYEHGDTSTNNLVVVANLAADNPQTR